MRVDITTDLTNGKMIKEYYESAYANKFDKLQEPTKNEQSTEDNYQYSWPSYKNSYLFH